MRIIPRGFNTKNTIKVDFKNYVIDSLRDYYKYEQNPVYGDSPQVNISFSIKNGDSLKFIGCDIGHASSDEYLHLKNISGIFYNDTITENFASVQPFEVESVLSISTIENIKRIGSFSYFYGVSDYTLHGGDRSNSFMMNAFERIDHNGKFNSLQLITNSIYGVTNGQSFSHINNNLIFFDKFTLSFKLNYPYSPNVVDGGLVNNLQYLTCLIGFLSKTGKSKPEDVKITVQLV